MALAPPVSARGVIVSPLISWLGTAEKASGGEVTLGCSAGPPSRLSLYGYTGVGRGMAASWYTARSPDPMAECEVLEGAGIRDEDGFWRQTLTAVGTSQYQCDTS